MALYTVAFLGLTAGVQMSDRGLQAVLLEGIEASFRVGDATIGALQGLASILFGSALAVPLGRVADRLSRKRVLLALIAGWTAMVALSALAPSFPLFFLGRSASGTLEFALIPVAYSLIPDLVREERRVAANLTFAALMAIGASAGAYFGQPLVDAAVGLIPGGLEPWRKAMLLLSLFGLPLLVGGTATLDPPRGHAPGEDGGAGSLVAFLRERWRAVGLFVGVAGSLLVAVQALNTLAALALQRRFGVSLGVVGQSLGVVTLAASLGSLPVAGLLDRALRRDVGIAAHPLIMGAGALAAIPCAMFLLRAVDFTQALVAVALFLFLTCVSNALVPTMLQDLTPVSVRARSFAVWSFVVSIFSALGPVLAGGLSDWLFGGRLLAAVATTAISALLICVFCAARAALLERR